MSENKGFRIWTLNAGNASSIPLKLSGLAPTIKALPMNVKRVHIPNYFVAFIDCDSLKLDLELY
jgi:hypothetical protein